MWAQDVGEVVGDEARWPEHEKTHLLGEEEARGREGAARPRRGEGEQPREGAAALGRGRRARGGSATVSLERPQVYF